MSLRISIKCLFSSPASFLLLGHSCWVRKLGHKPWLHRQIENVGLSVIQCDCGSTHFALGGNRVGDDIYMQAICSVCMEISQTFRMVREIKMLRSGAETDQDTLDDMVSDDE